MKNKKLPLKLNKKNAIAFAKYLFSNKNGKTSYIKLCDRSIRKEALSDEINKPMHCAIGEAFTKFVGPSTSGLSTSRAIDGLIKAAGYSKSEFENDNDHFELFTAIEECVKVNDAHSTIVNRDYHSEEIYLNRAKLVAKTWLEKVVPLIKD